MKIFVGSDHAGYGLKEKLVESLKGAGHEVVDKGALEYNEGDDYPDFVIPVAEEVSKNPDNSRGIILGATGQAEAFTANKFPHVRAVVYYGKSECVVDDEADVIIRSREHNNSNILSLGARYLTEEDMLKTVNIWIDTVYTGTEKHVRRLAKIDAIHIK
jgi:ribose 5-phosphate isomerase B